MAPGRARRRGKGDASGWRRSRAKSEELRPLVKTMGFSCGKHGETHDGDVDMGKQDGFMDFMRNKR